VGRRLPPARRRLRHKGRGGQTSLDNCILLCFLCRYRHKKHYADQASTPPVRREGTPIKLAFHVPSIEDLRPVVARFGGQLNSAGTQWEFRGLRHCDGLDPEGNVVQMTEPLVHGARPAPLLS
jgi:hypothetical protein